MAHKFDDEEKTVKEFTDKLSFGVHKVQLVTVEQGETDAGKDFIELTVATADGLEDTARVWFVGGASNISFNTLRQIAVHNAKTDTAKEKARQAVDTVADSAALADLLTENCLGGELWITKYYDPKRTYQAADGSTRKSINKNVYGYEPRLNEALMPRDGQQEELNATFPEGEKATGNAAANIPDSWA